MGIVEVAKMGEHFQRTRRKSAEVLDAPNLFSGATKIEMVVQAVPLNDWKFEQGQRLVLRLTEDRIVVLNENRKVGEVIDPLPSVLDSVRTVGSGHAKGGVLNVM